MNLLLDTHVLVWWLAGSDELSARSRDAIASPGSFVWVSAASVWEVAIKRARGRIRAPADLGHWINVAEFSELPILISHAEVAGGLPMHHSDPFDRILVAQAQVEGLTLVTRDDTLEAYGVPLLAA